MAESSAEKEERIKKMWAPRKPKTLEQKPPAEQFAKWGGVGNLDVIGHTILEVDEGPRIDKLQRQRYMRVIRPYDILYDHSYGNVSKFFEGLLEKRIWGTHCPVCHDTFCPPRNHCWRNSCKLTKTEWVELKPRGMLHCYSVLCFASEAFLPQLPFILGYVRIDGCNTLMAMRVVTDKIEEVECDTPVELKFIDEPKGNVMDLYAVPIEGRSRRTPEQKERLKQQLEPTKAWVKKRFG
jgi:uncharacterized OB-fold protein